MNMRAAFLSVQSKSCLICLTWLYALAGTTQNAYSAGEGWSVLPHAGISQLSDQAGSFGSAVDIADGEFDVALNSGFTAGLSFRHDYSNSPWTTEFGWEYRSNDSEITTSDAMTLAAGNYASNTFFLNGRYALADTWQFTPWLGAGISILQEIDLDSEGAGPERSFSTSGDIGYQLMAGVDYDISERLYLTLEVRYTQFSDLDLTEEGGSGLISGIDYKPVTAGVGLGIRF